MDETNSRQPIAVNPELVWDYDIPADSEQNEAFRKWYIARVLTRGRANDIKSIGLKTIYHYLPLLHLPKPIHRFWMWYFNIPENQLSARGGPQSAGRFRRRMTYLSQSRGLLSPQSVKQLRGYLCRAVLAAIGQTALADSFYIVI